jgi:hypothetical protein
MIKRLKIKSSRFLSDETGQALIIVLTLLLLGSLTITPVLLHVGTAVKTGRVYEDKAGELYAADAGVEDAIWQIKYERLESLLTDPAYDPYDFGTTWTYGLSEPINDMDTTVEIENIWIPYGISPPSAAASREIIEEGKLMVTGNAPTDSDCRIKVLFYPDEGEEDALKVETLGIWLPVGYSYVSGSSNLEADPYYWVPVIEPYAGGQAVVWSFASENFTSFPDVNPLDSPMMTEVTFEFSANETGTSPATLSWITTSGVSDVPISWDADTKVFHITSTAGETEIEVYSVNCGLRKLGSAISGDYRAIGNSLMVNTDGDTWGIREDKLDESYTEVDDIPSDAVVVAALLYWSAWFKGCDTQSLWEDVCSDFGEWISGSCWNIDSGHFRSHYSGGAEQTRYLTMKDSLDLSAYTSPMAKVAWEHWEEGGLSSSDALKFQFSGDGGASWGEMYTAFANDLWWQPESFSYTIPDEYLTDHFKMRFYLQGFSDDGEYCHIDDIAVSEVVLTSVSDDTAILKINDQQVYLDEEGDPQIGDGEITASQCFVLEDEPGEYSYACNRNVTKLVQEYSNLGDNENRTGNGKYTVGGVDADTGVWEQQAYAGWSLIIIYSSVDTHGHQLFLYDTFAYCGSDENLDFDDDGVPGGTITGFIVPEPIEDDLIAAKLTCFVGEGDECWLPDYLKFNDTELSNDESPWNNVWNSESPGMSEDGVDIDTFEITWESGLLAPDDTSAQVDMITGVDRWNLIYIILSFRSEITTRGTAHYAIHS